MEIRIVAPDDERAAWRVYLNDFFIVCHSQAEAEETARRARESVQPPFTPAQNELVPVAERNTD